MFIDLNIQYTNRTNTKERIRQAFLCGYKIVAVSINYNVKYMDDFNKLWKVLVYSTCKETKIVKENAESLGEPKQNSSTYLQDNTERCGNYFLNRMTDPNIKIETQHLPSEKHTFLDDYIIINKNNGFDAKGTCEDFIVPLTSEITREEINQIKTYFPKDLSIHLSESTGTYILKRINFVYRNGMDVQSYNKMLQHCPFDIIAIEAKSREEINKIGSSFHCDIIFFDLTHDFHNVRKTDFQIALSRGIYFEINMKDLMDVGKEIYRNGLMNLSALLNVIPWNRIIFSSGSLSLHDAISPDFFIRYIRINTDIYDKNFKQLLTTNPLACIQRASVRKSQNTAVFEKKNNLRRPT